MNSSNSVIAVILLALLLTACNGQKSKLIDNTWIMYERIQEDLSTNEVVKSKFSKVDQALVLNFDKTGLTRTENGVSMEGEWEILDDNLLQMMGEKYEIVRLRNLGMILATERKGYRQQYLFAPEDCPCWKN